jgi:hypothetical protein
MRIPIISMPTFPPTYHDHGLLSPYVLWALDEDAGVILQDRVAAPRGRDVSKTGEIMKKKVLYVGLDVHKASISVTVAEDGGLLAKSYG